jgi:glycosyltransferase involved in cell wall biosynthesis
MSSSPAELVTVVVPAYNAASTIDETLLSVRAQSHAQLEVIVVDDGSTDHTAEIVASHARADPRVVLIRQQNRGVAAARNAAIAHGKGDFVAPIDADDLWHPLKIEMQLAAMRRGGDRVGLVYNWSAILDEHSRVTQFGGRYHHEGDVLRSMCEFNLVGNGSSALMRTDAIRRVGGYDASLVGMQAQGCEDWALYLAIAEHFEFALVPEYLTGYRSLPTSMSGDLEQMWRSCCLVEKKFRARRPDLARHLRQGLANMCHTVYQHAKGRGLDESARAHLRRLVLSMPYYAAKFFVYRPLRSNVRRMFAAQRTLETNPTGGRFLPAAAAAQQRVLRG